MADLTDMELLAHIEMTYAAVAEMETNLGTLNDELARYLDELAVRKGAGRMEDPMDQYAGKLERLYKFIINFTCSSMPKKRASCRFVQVPRYRNPKGELRTDPLEYRIDEENDVHMTVTFFVSTDELRNFVASWWRSKFGNFNWIYSV